MCRARYYRYDKAQTQIDKLAWICERGYYRNQQIIIIILIIHIHHTHDVIHIVLYCLITSVQSYLFCCRKSTTMTWHLERERTIERRMKRKMNKNKKMIFHSQVWLFHIFGHIRALKYQYYRRMRSFLGSCLSHQKWPKTSKNRFCSLKILIFKTITIRKPNTQSGWNRKPFGKCIYNYAFMHILRWQRK